MKSSIWQKEETEITYPCLMKSKNGEVVLFSEENCGVVIYPGKNSWKVGNFCSTWDMRYFEKETHSFIIGN